MTKEKALQAIKLLEEIETIDMLNEELANFLASEQFGAVPKSGWRDRSWKPTGVKACVGSNPTCTAILSYNAWSKRCICTKSNKLGEVPCG